MKKKILVPWALLLLCGMNTSYGAQTDASNVLPEAHSVDAAFLAAAHLPGIVNLVTAWQVTDKEGEHILVLNRHTGPSPSHPKSGRVEHIDIAASYYSRSAGTWKVAWTIRDAVDCPGLDAAAEFFISAVSFTDLNKDGIAEITVPYKLFCGGGIDSSTIKVILREGATKLALRGDSLVKLPGQPAFGGEHRYDKDLLTPKLLAYKQHMDKIWASVAEESRN